MHATGIKRSIDTSLPPTGEPLLSKKAKYDHHEITPQNPQQRYTPKSPLFPLSPADKSPIKFCIDTKTFEDIKSAGLALRIVQKNRYRSYELTNIQSELVAKNWPLPFSYSNWINISVASKIKSGQKPLIIQYDNYILELSLSDISLFKSHLLAERRSIQTISELHGEQVLGYLSFNENTAQNSWLDVHHLFVIPEAQNLGIGTLLVRSVASIGHVNQKEGVEFSNPFLYPASARFYRMKGLKLLYPIHTRERHPGIGCAQLALKTSEGLAQRHPLIPRSSTELETRQLPSPDPTSLC